MQRASEEPFETLGASTVLPRASENPFIVHRSAGEDIMRRAPTGEDGVLLRVPKEPFKRMGGNDVLRRTPGEHLKTLSGSGVLLRPQRKLSRSRALNPLPVVLDCNICIASLPGYPM